jgi:hypothetical protein
MKLVTGFLAVFMLSFLIGCGASTNTTSEGDIPAWYLQEPNNPDYLFAAASATSKDLQLAIDKATTDARANIAQQVQLKLEGLQKSFTEEVGTGENANLLEQFTTATKTVVATELTGSQVEKKEVIQDGDLFRSYILVKYPIGAAGQALLGQLKNKEELYTRFRSSQAYKELEEEIKKMKESNN